ncbi:hypothetical protein AA103196_1339 [Ameyamaea chiangmaiensis NBRC 103196]|uniref:Uncharacterized protein n=1 Tax=Ameyamaea chiangmaiensis TaxID=442969 RepID=A0A850PC12_9PROT|nr:hypothetical protein [Ameyamaea chiangmaiensis]MBS4075161.1 hypothetical protein [Ameyamaea chiangmaiensis]NVN40209.1 hypothetical protein [Ameyamaea chiangmaiensis]GBQ66274.1 hypothetical protein AA103196_1339 [Ameyamaea chiangmaiensis NBRC 103196]
MFTHEYAHTFVAWALRWKNNPFALHVPPLSTASLLIQSDVDQNVNEAPIMASGRGVDVGLIALAAPLLGNAIVSLTLGVLLYRLGRRWNRHVAMRLGFWLVVATLGNVLDYVPIRTFTLSGDMGSLQRGFGWSPWTIIAVLGAPTLLSLLWLLVRFIPDTARLLFPTSRVNLCVLSVVAKGVVFVFYGAAGLMEGGPVSFRLS